MPPPERDALLHEEIRFTIRSTADYCFISFRQLFDVDAIIRARYAELRLLPDASCHTMLQISPYSIESMENIETRIFR